MKKNILLVALTFLFIFPNIKAQSPEGFNYQCIIRDNTGQTIVNQAVGVQFSILQGSITGTSVYTETHSANTNGYGLITLTIGSGTTSDDLSTIDWGMGPYFIHVEADPSGGTSYDDVSTTQMMSVPYAMYAKYGEDADMDITNEIQDISLSGTDLTITSGSTVDLSSIQDGTGTDNQNISGSGLSGTNLTIGIQDGTSEVVDLSSLQDGVNDADSDPTNEIQDISLNGTDLSISSGSTVDLSSLQDDGDWTGGGSGTMYSTSISDNISIGTSNNYGSKLFIVGDGTQRVIRAQTPSGSTKFLVDGNGGVGIGTGLTAPPSGGLIVDGDVGIGTTSPIAELHLSGGRILFSLDDATYDSYINLNNTSHNLRIQTTGSAFASFNGDRSVGLGLQSGDYVGVGSNAPQAKFYVEGSGLSNADMGIYKNTLSTGSSALTFLNNDVSSQLSMGVNGTAHSSASNGFIWMYNDHDIRIGTNSTQRMVIKNDGKIGIGTNVPENILDVDGDVGGLMIGYKNFYADDQNISDDYELISNDNNTSDHAYISFVAPSHGRVLIICDGRYGSGDGETPAETISLKLTNNSSDIGFAQDALIAHNTYDEYQFHVEFNLSGWLVPGNSYQLYLNIEGMSTSLADDYVKGPVYMKAITLPSNYNN